MSKTPPEQRKHQRYELYAQVQVSRDAEVHIMSTNDISHGGLFLQGKPSDYPDLKIGTNLEITLFAVLEGEPEADITISAKVARTQSDKSGGKGPGIGLQFVNMSKEASEKLDHLIKKSSAP